MCMGGEDAYGRKRPAGAAHLLTLCGLAASAHAQDRSGGMAEELSFSSVKAHPRS